MLRKQIDERDNELHLPSVTTQASVRTESKAALAPSPGTVSRTAEMGHLPCSHSKEKVLGHFPTGGHQGGAF